MMFDRVIFLSDGYTIYNGPPEQCFAYMQQFGLRSLSHTNPADKMSIIAALPKKILRKDITINMLAKECEKQLKKYNHIQIDEKHMACSILSRRFTMIEESRKVGWCTQFSLLYKRNMTSALRNPLQLLAVVILGLIQSFLLVCLFGGVGAEKIEIIYVPSEKGIPIPTVNPEDDVP